MILVGSASPNLLSGNSILLPAEELSFRHTQVLESSFLQGSVDIGLVRKIETKPLVVAIPKSRWGGQCLAYIQKIKNYHTEEFSGYPNRIRYNEEDARIGYAVLTTEGSVGHIALITDIIDNDLVLLESNFNKREIITNDRILNMNDLVIRGYYNFDDNKDVEEII